MPSTVLRHNKTFVCLSSLPDCIVRASVLSICPAVCPSVSDSVSLSLSLSVCLSFCLSVSLPLCLSVSLFVCRCCLVASLLAGYGDGFTIRFQEQDHYSFPKMKFDPWAKQCDMASMSQVYGDIQIYHQFYCMAETVPLGPQKVAWSMLGLGYHRPKSTRKSFQFACRSCCRATMPMDPKDQASEEAMKAILAPYITGSGMPPPPPPTPEQIAEYTSLIDKYPCYWNHLRQQLPAVATSQGTGHDGNVSLVNDPPTPSESGTSTTAATSTAASQSTHWHMASQSSTAPAQSSMWNRHIDGPVTIASESMTSTTAANWHSWRWNNWYNNVRDDRTDQWNNSWYSNNSNTGWGWHANDNWNAADGPSVVAPVRDAPTVDEWYAHCPACQREWRLPEPHMGVCPRCELAVRLGRLTDAANPV